MGINALWGRVSRAKPRQTARNYRKNHVFCTSFGVILVYQYLTDVNYRIPARKLTPAQRESGRRPLNAGQVLESSSPQVLHLPYSSRP